MEARGNAQEIGGLGSSSRASRMKDQLWQSTTTRDDVTKERRRHRVTRQEAHVGVGWLGKEDLCITATPSKRDYHASKQTKAREQMN